MYRDSLKKNNNKILKILKKINKKKGEREKLLLIDKEIGVKSQSGAREFKASTFCSTGKDQTRKQTFYSSTNVSNVKWMTGECEETETNWDEALSHSCLHYNLFSW